MFFKALFTSVVLLLSTAVAAQTVSTQNIIPAPPQLAAKAWVLMDAQTGKILLEQNADERLPPASLTKMMTSYIVSEEILQGRIKESDMVTMSENAWREGGAASGGSTMYVPVNSQASVIDMLRGVIIQSGNDASIALAEHVSGSEAAFADQMTQLAHRMGMKDTEFHNATGLPSEGHLTTARDLAILGRALVYDHPAHYKLYSEKYFEYNNIRQPNRNSLLWQDASVDGIKTGYTKEAGYCLVTSAERSGMRLISVVLGTASTKARAAESKKLLTYGFRYFETRRIYSAGEALKSNLRVWYGEEDYLNLVLANDVILSLPRGSADQLEATIEVDEPLHAPIDAAETLGRLEIKLNGEVVADVPLIAEKAIPEAGMFSRLWDWIQLFFAGLFS